MIPTDIAGLKLWLKADSLALADNDPVATWADSSGNGNNAVQATEVRKPIFKTNILNSLPVVRFDGSDDDLSSTFALSTPFTVLMVVRTSGAGQNAQGHVTGWAGSEDAIGFNTNGLLVRMVVASGAITFTTPTNNVWELRAFVFNGASSLTTKDRSSDATGTVGTNTYSFTTIGDDASGARHFVGDVAEYILYDSALSTTDRQGIENYLYEKWFVAISPSFRINRLRPAFFKPGLAR